MFKNVGRTFLLVLIMVSLASCAYRGEPLRVKLIDAETKEPIKEGYLGVAQVEGAGISTRVSERTIHIIEDGRVDVPGLKSDHRFSFFPASRGYMIGVWEASLRSEDISKYGIDNPFKIHLKPIGGDTTEVQAQTIEDNYVSNLLGAMKSYVYADNSSRPDPHDFFNYIRSELKRMEEEYKADVDWDRFERYTHKIISSLESKNDVLPKNKSKPYGLYEKWKWEPISTIPPPFLKVGYGAKNDIRGWKFRVGSEAGQCFPYQVAVPLEGETPYRVRFKISQLSGTINNSYRAGYVGVGSFNEGSRICDSKHWFTDHGIAGVQIKSGIKGDRILPKEEADWRSIRSFVGGDSIPRPIVQQIRNLYNVDILFQGDSTVLTVKNEDGSILQRLKSTATISPEYLVMGSRGTEKNSSSLDDLMVYDPKVQYLPDGRLKSFEPGHSAKNWRFSIDQSEGFHYRGPTASAFRHFQWERPSGTKSNFLQVGKNPKSQREGAVKLHGGSTGKNCASHKLKIGVSADSIKSIRFNMGKVTGNRAKEAWGLIFGIGNNIESPSREDCNPVKWMSEANGAGLVITRDHPAKPSFDGSFRTWTRNYPENKREKINAYEDYLVKFSYGENYTEIEVRNEEHELLKRSRVPTLISPEEMIFVAYGTKQFNSKSDKFILHSFRAETEFGMVRSFDRTFEGY